MKLSYFSAACALISLVLPTFASGQTTAPDANAIITTPETTAPPATISDNVDAGCELHVWPTENYLGFNSGLLSGFGLVGVVADMEAHKGRVATVKDLMADYVGPEVQVDELKKVGLAHILGLDGYRLIIENPTPSHEAVKANPELKAKTKALNAKLKSGERISDSKNPCYAEFIITNIMYHKAMMYGSNLFVGTLFRNYGDKGGAPVVSAGAVKNPLENFPPKSVDMIPAAKAELREAFGKDFIEWSQKKLKK